MSVTGASIVYVNQVAPAQGPFDPVVEVRVVDANVQKDHFGNGGKLSSFNIPSG